jgi:hypothetical protein
MDTSLIVVENFVDLQCRRHVHLMSNQEHGLEILRPYGAQTGVVTKETGAWHYRSSFPWRGPLDIACVGSRMRFRRLVVWNLEGCGSVRNAIAQAAEYFFCCAHFRPGYAFILRMPAGVENGVEVGEGLQIFEAEWMLERSIAVGGRDF